MMYRLGIFLMVWMSSWGVMAQNWSCDTLITVSKTTDHVAVHHYGAIHNLNQQDQLLHWEVTLRNIPPQWEIYLDDPSAPYDTVQTGDNRDFTLSGNVDPQFPEKMIFGMDHGNTVGAGQVDYLIYSVNNPADSAHMVFDITISAGTGIHEVGTTTDLYFDGTGQLVLPKHTERLRFYDMAGRQLDDVQIRGSQTYMPGDHIKGIFLVEVKVGNRITYHKMIR